jgi:hypothetical protein
MPAFCILFNRTCVRLKRRTTLELVGDARGAEGGHDTGSDHYPRGRYLVGEMLALFCT